jgi:hypothetical protein
MLSSVFGEATLVHWVHPSPQRKRGSVRGLAGWNADSLARASGLHGSGALSKPAAQARENGAASKLRVDRFLLIDRQQAVVDLEREDRQGRVDEPTTRCRVAVIEEPAARLVGDA